MRNHLLILLTQFPWFGFFKFINTWIIYIRCYDQIHHRIIIDLVEEHYTNTLLLIQNPNSKSRIVNAMERFDCEEFPGFQTVGPREGCMVTRKPPLSRLQRRAPCPLLLKPTTRECRSVNQTSETSKLGSYLSSKDPIPLLSPLVLPSMLQSDAIHHDTMPNSH